MNKLGLALFVTTAIFAGNALADQDIKHPNLRDAYHASNEAIHHITQAQEINNNHGEFGGHAEKAKHLLEEAKHEIEAADAFRDAHMH